MTDTVKRGLRHILALVLALWMVCCAAVGGFAANNGPITTDTTLKELGQRDAFKKNDAYPYYGNLDLMNTIRMNDSIADIAIDGAADDCVAALNKFEKNYNDGKTVRFKIYDEAACKEDPTRANVDLYYYPAKEKHQKFIISVPGGGYLYLTQLGEGFDIANQFNDLGYNAFSLKYRVGSEAAGNRPLEDLTQAVRFVLAHAEELGIDPEGYALCGFSAGGHVVSSFGTKDLGYEKAGLPKPGLLILGYPLICTEKIDTIFADLLEGEMLSEEAATKYCVEKHITPDYPRVYEFDGVDDYLLDYNQQILALDAALNENKVPHVTKIYKNVEHGSGAGQNSDNHGWIAQAASYWAAHS